MKERYPSSSNSENNQFNANDTANPWLEMSHSLPASPITSQNNESKIVIDQTVPNFEKPKLGVVEDLTDDQPETEFANSNTASDLDFSSQATEAKIANPKSFTDLPDEILETDLMRGFDQTETSPLGQIEDFSRDYPDEEAITNELDPDSLELHDAAFDESPEPKLNLLDDPVEAMFEAENLEQAMGLEGLESSGEPLDTESDQAIVTHILEQINNDHERYQPEDHEKHHELDQITEIFSQISIGLAVPENELSVPEMLDQLSEQYTAQAELATSAALERENLQKAELALEWKELYDDIRNQSGETAA